MKNKEHWKRTARLWLRFQEGQELINPGPWEMFVFCHEKSNGDLLPQNKGSYILITGKNWAKHVWMQLPGVKIKMYKWK